MVYDWIFASTRFALETKWNCGDNDLYLYVILILNDLAMLWFDSYKYMVYVDNHMLWNFNWDSCKHMIHIENYMFVVVIYNTHLVNASIRFMLKQQLYVVIVYLKFMQVYDSFLCQHDV